MVASFLRLGKSTLLTLDFELIRSNRMRREGACERFCIKCQDQYSDVHASRMFRQSMMPKSIKKLDPVHERQQQQQNVECDGNILHVLRNA